MPGESPSVSGELRPLLGRRLRAPRRGWRRVAAAALLLVVVLERLAFFGVAANLVLYLNSADFKWAGSQASRAALVFLGASQLLAPVGGWLADVYLGRSCAIALSLLLYLAGSALLAATACPDGRASFCGSLLPAPLQPACPAPGCPPATPAPYCAPTIYGALLLLGLAASSVRSNLPSFGADQVSGSSRGGGTWALGSPGPGRCSDPGQATSLFCLCVLGAGCGGDGHSVFHGWALG